MINEAERLRVGKTSRPKNDHKVNPQKTVVIPDSDVKLALGSKEQKIMPDVFHRKPSKSPRW